LLEKKNGGSKNSVPYTSLFLYLVLERYSIFFLYKKNKKTEKASRYQTKPDDIGRNSAQVAQ
jgi:hypothetical protein